MQLGMIGLGRMGANLARRLRAAGHEVVVHDRDPAAVAALEAEGFAGATDLDGLAAALERPRVVWVMVPAGVTGAVVDGLAGHLVGGDVVIDGGNSLHLDDRARAAVLAERGIGFVDVGTSGGVHGLERGYCLMVGGDDEVVARLAPLFEALAPGVDAAPRTPGRSGPAAPGEAGWLHCGPVGAGHFVKMVHNGIEYGMMAAYAEGLAILERARSGGDDAGDAETAPAVPGYDYDVDVAAVAEVWRRGSVVGSWLLDLTAEALAADPRLGAYEGRVSDSGEGRWTVRAAVDLGVPADVITASLFARFHSRDEGRFAGQVLSAMRAGFGGHVERPSA